MVVHIENCSLTTQLFKVAFFSGILVAIREMQFGDLDVVCRLYLDANNFSDFITIRKWTERNRQKFSYIHLVYEENRILAAVSSTIKEPGVGHIEDIAVEAASRNRGLGTQLLNAVITKYCVMDIREVRLWVHRANYAAIPFYLHHGFQVMREERTQGMVDVPDGELITWMERRI